LKNQSIFSTLWEILKHLWNKRVPDAINLFLNSSWSNEGAYLVDAMIQEIRLTEIRRISLVYRSMFVKDLEAKLLFSTDDVVLLCRKYGWLVDENGGVTITPLPTQVTDSSSLDANADEQGMHVCPYISYFIFIIRIIT
jgi:hypothetical protein